MNQTKSANKNTPSINEHNDAMTTIDKNKTKKSHQSTLLILKQNNLLNL